MAVSTNSQSTLQLRSGAEELIQCGQQIVAATGEDRFFALASMIWDTLLTGLIPISGAEPLPVTSRQWIDLVKWLGKHMDGGLRPISAESDPIPAPAAGEDSSPPVDDRVPTFGWTAENDPAPPAHGDLRSTTPLASTNRTDSPDSTDALPQLNAYLSQFSASAAATPVRLYVKPPPIVQLVTPH